jgi:hypothetical protein
MVSAISKQKHGLDKLPEGTAVMAEHEVSALVISCVSRLIPQDLAPRWQVPQLFLKKNFQHGLITSGVKGRDRVELIVDLASSHPRRFYHSRNFVSSNSWAWKGSTWAKCLLVLYWPLYSLVGRSAYKHFSRPRRYSWTCVKAHLHLFLYGRSPATRRWRSLED